MNQNRLLTILLIAAIAVFAVHIFNLKTEAARLDLTETDLYSLNPGTLQILEKMNKEGVKPIDIKLYFSATTGKSLPKFIKNFITYESYVRNLLKEYERASQGKIRLQFIDPITDSDEAEDAADFRLDGKAINQHGDLFYFGLAMVTQTGSKDVIDFLWPEKQDTIEYEISKKIHSLLWPQKKRIAVLSGLEVLPDNNPYLARIRMAQGQQPEEPWIIMDVLKEQYEVTRLEKDVDTISKDEYDLLLVIHPKGFGDKQLWTINQWVVTGGETIVLLDPYSIEDKAPNNPNQPWAQLQYEPSSTLGKLSEAWGLELPRNEFAVDWDLSFKGPVDRRGTVERNLVYMSISDKFADQVFNRDVPIFNGLENVSFFLAGHLNKKEGAEGEFTPLIKTTSQGAVLSIEPGFGGGDKLSYADLNTPTKFLDQYKPDGEKVLAYMIKGKLKDAFPEGASFPASTPETPPGMPPGFQMPPDENAEMITREAIPADQHAETRLLVFADADFISDQVAFQRSFFGVSATNDNHKILLNSIDFLLGAEELMQVRSKTRIHRSFERFEEIEALADQNVAEQEQRIRTDIEHFQEEMREKQGGINKENAVLFKKKLADEVSQLEEKIREGEKQLREIKKEKRKVLEGEESRVRFIIMWLMPILVCLVGLMSWFTKQQARNSKRAIKEG